MNDEAIWLRLETVTKRYDFPSIDAARKFIDTAGVPTKKLGGTIRVRPEHMDAIMTTRTDGTPKFLAFVASLRRKSA